MKRLIVFLIRKRLGLKLGERFTFKGQKSRTHYYFAKDRLVKVWECENVETNSTVSLNWLLNDECEIKKMD